MNCILKVSRLSGEGVFQFKVFASKELKTIIDFALNERNKDVRFRNVWIIFDRDIVSNFDGWIDVVKQAQMKAGWSNPCFEIWMSAYLGKMKNAGTTHISSWMYILIVFRSGTLPNTLTFSFITRAGVDITP